MSIIHEEQILLQKCPYCTTCDLWIFLCTLCETGRLYRLQPSTNSSAAASRRASHLASSAGVLVHSAGEGQRSTQVSLPNIYINLTHRGEEGGLQSCLRGLWIHLHHRSRCTITIFQRSSCFVACLHLLSVCPIFDTCVYLIQVSETSLNGPELIDFWCGGGTWGYSMTHFHLAINEHNIPPKTPVHSLKLWLSLLLQGNWNSKNLLARIVLKNPNRRVDALFICSLSCLIPVIAAPYLLVSLSTVHWSSLGPMMRYREPCWRFRPSLQDPRDMKSRFWPTSTPASMPGWWEGTFGIIYNFFFFWGFSAFLLHLIPCDLVILSCKLRSKGV